MAFVGDDLTDLPAFDVAGVKIAVADAAELVRMRADWVTPRAGGRGAVRDAIEEILRRQGRLERPSRLIWPAGAMRARRRPAVTTMSTLHILHTNDFHDHLSEAAGRVYPARKRRGWTNVLLLDAGDAVSAGNIGVRPGGEPILTRMSETGYDAMTLGNREFHVADALLRLKIGKATFPILCANIRWREDRGETLPVVPHVIQTLPNGLRVGVFGLTVPMVTPRMAARVVSAFLFDDPVAAAGGRSRLLRPQVDVLIALTHIGLREDERLARSCPELDLIVGGHSHVVLPRAAGVNGVPIVQGGWFGHYLGHVTLEIGEDRASDVSGRLISLKE